ncbi:thioredoxin domain-containing protein [Gordonia desulfuricans]|uniref:Thioredoxin domain-containing protein n=1 Tax=Gordonia desulfuricans TaxID=89051 RepID=A0A7K3LR17_9ACTN|nr:thioredoxin domain-containing protein [Gordonia desulfuricans]NDK90679.1 thioredoxin domain-containing protein [Gordonia desulfuricans]
MANKPRKPVVDPRAAERRRSLFMKIGTVVAVVVIAVVVFVAIVLTNKSSTGDATAPSVATGDAFRITAAPAGTTPAVTVTILEDFQCPACKQFEQLYGDALAQLRTNPKVAVDYRPIAILDRMSTTDYSTRAANASACVAESTKGANNFEVWLKFHNLLYLNQPTEGGAGLTDSQLTTYANQAGAQNISDCVNDGQFKSWVADQTKSADVTATPTVRINGKDVELSTPDALLAAVNEAGGAQQ